MKRTLKIWLALLYLVSSCCPLWSISAKDSFFKDKAYILYNLSDQYVDQQRFADNLVDPGIYTQWMTAWIIIENTRHFDKVLTVGFDDFGSKYYYGFDMQEQVTVQDALFAILFCNSGEMANAAAKHMTGDKNEFIRLMNQKAASLGMKDTYFTNITGDVEPGQKTTLSDLTIFIQAILQDQTFQAIISKHTYTFTSNRKQHTLENENWYPLEQETIDSCFMLAMNEQTYSAFSIATIQQKKFLTIGTGDTRQACANSTADLYQDMNDTYHSLIPFEKNSVIAYDELGLLWKKQIPIQMQKDITLLVDSDKTYDTLSYRFVSCHHPFVILPNQSLGSVQIYHDGQLLCSKEIYSDNFYVSNEWIFLVGIVCMPVVFKIIYRQKKKR